MLFSHRMTVLAWLALFLSWGSLGLETATVVVSRPSEAVMMRAGPGLEGMRSRK